MKRLSGLAIFFTAVALAILAAGGPAIAQPAPGNVALHGHILNPAGMPVTSGTVKLTLDKGKSAKDMTFKYTFPIDANGNYSGKDIVPGDYEALVFSTDNKSLDFQDLSVKMGDDKTLDFDMSRAEFIKAMSPEDRKALEEYKKKNSGIAADNAKVANFNKTMADAQALENSGNAAEAVKLLQDLPPARPTEPILWSALGQAQLLAGDQAQQAARAAKTSTMDPAIVATLDGAVASYLKAIELAPSNKKLTPETVASYYVNLGQAYSKEGKLTEAGEAYETSAKTSPAKAAMAYYNEAVVFYNGQKLKEAAAAADKAIAADPKRADTYWIKAQALLQGEPNLAPDPKTGKFVLPPGCLEAYQEYLELAPTGSHANDVKELLNGLGQPVKNSYKAGKKP